jgi:hypothetical protein
MRFRSWDTITVDRLRVRPTRASATSADDSASRPVVGSSRIRIGVSLMNARAIANRCRCPPDSVAARSPRTAS